MRRMLGVLPVWLMCMAVQGATGGAAAKGGEVATLEAEWKDVKREVGVPVKIYYPKDLGARKEGVPLIVFSHGLGGSREGYAMWGEAWAAQGYIVVHPTHVGSDSSLLTEGGGRIGGARGAMQKLAPAANLQNALKRCADVSFVIDEMTKANEGTLEGAGMAVFKGKVDVKHIGMAGHSFGAQTTLSIAGEGFGLGAKENRGDPRVTAAVAMSPQPGKLTAPEKAFGGIKIPVFHITGTADDSPIGDVKAAERVIPYEHSKAAGTLLLVFKDANHMAFGTKAERFELASRLRGTTVPSIDIEALQETVKKTTTAFWDLHLKGKAEQGEWLTHEFPKGLQGEATFSAK